MLQLSLQKTIQLTQINKITIPVKNLVLTNNTVSVFHQHISQNKFRNRNNTKLFYFHPYLKNLFLRSEIMSNISNLSINLQLISTLSLIQSMQQENLGLNSLEISKQLIHNTKGYQNILTIFKEKKHHDYKKFSNHICSILKADQAAFDITAQSLSKICSSMESAKISSYQAGSIIAGFIQYWQQTCTIKFKDLNEFILKNWNKFDTLLIYEKLLEFIRKVALKCSQLQQFQKSLKKLVYNTLQDNDPQLQSQKILYFIKYGQLYDDFNKQFILQKIVNCRYQSVKFFYNILSDSVSKKQIQKLIEKLKLQYIDYTFQTRRDKEMQAAIKDWNIDVTKNNKVVENGYRKYLNYVTKENKLFFVEDLIKNYPVIIELLVDMLSKQRRKSKQVLHFINKYGVKQQLKKTIIEDLMNSRGQYRQNLETFQMKNILYENDCFGPTQLSVLGQPDETYLMLPQFGIQEKDVIFVDDSNFAQVGFSELKKSKIIGLDCQSVSAKYKNGQQFVSIAQFSTLHRVFIYDLVELKKNEKFLTEIVQLFNTYKGSFAGHSVKTDIKELFVEIKKHNKINHEKLNILDTLEIYQAKFKKKQKLCNICKQLCGFSMSKYEQCSGWGNRPLRKAQLHYAALDAFVPIKILQTLLTTKFE